MIYPYIYIYIKKARQTKHGQRNKSGAPTRI
jgi:hypothetical protein